MRLPSRESDAGPLQAMFDSVADAWHDPNPDPDPMLWMDEYDERMDRE